MHTGGTEHCAVINGLLFMLSNHILCLLTGQSFCLDVILASSSEN